MIERIPTKIPSAILFAPRIFGDSRGYFGETFRRDIYEGELGLSFVQDNLSFSKKHTLRGLHLQHPNDQGKLVYVLKGSVLDVAVDVRVGSPTFGEHVAVELNETNRHQLWVPPGFAHGFCVLSEEALFAYKCTDYYSPASELGVLFSDPDLGIAWPTTEPILSDKDKIYPRLAEIDPSKLPTYIG